MFPGVGQVDFEGILFNNRFGLRAMPNRLPFKKTKKM